MTVFVQMLVQTASATVGLAPPPRQLGGGDCAAPSQCNYHLLATSVSTSSNRLQEHLVYVSGNGYKVCQYRKGFLDHWKPRAFMTNSFRIVTQQATLIMANFMTAQLEQDMKRSDLVQQGAISQAEANEQGEEWEKQEWAKRWQVFPTKLLTAFLKYHVITLVIRSYEWIADQMYDKITLDKLTMDPFMAARNYTSQHPNASNQQVVTKMYATTFWANCLAILADYSVHQAILCFGYYRYYQKYRQQQKHKEGEEGAILTSMVKKSTQLAMHRSFGLICCSMGGAFGTLVRPGWGTLICSNMGEGVASVFVDDGQTSIQK